MANTMTLVSTVTVGAGGAASIDFTGIPQTGTDLYLVFSGRTTTGTTTYADSLYIRLNGVATNMNFVRVRGLGSGAPISDSGTGNSLLSDGTTATASTFSNANIYLTNYTTSVKKTFSGDMVTENNATEGVQIILAGDSNTVTAAITQLSITNGTFEQYTTASLYIIDKTGATGATVA